MLGAKYTGTLTTSFIKMGILCFSAELSGSFDSRDINELLEMLNGRKIEISIREVPL